MPIDSIRPATETWFVVAIVMAIVGLTLFVGCANVAVYPGDILMGDEEGVVVIPRYLAADIAGPAAEQELMEKFILEKVQNGAAIPGTYPPLTIWR